MGEQSRSQNMGLLSLQFFSYYSKTKNCTFAMAVLCTLSGTSSNCFVSEL